MKIHPKITISVSNSDSLLSILNALDEQGIRLAPPGFPVQLMKNDAGSVTVWLDHPSIFDGLPKDEFGIAVFDRENCCLADWGLAKKIIENNFDSEPLVREAFKKGKSSSSNGEIYLHAHRKGEHVILLTLAVEELGGAYLALKNAEREAVALKRIGRALAMNQTLQPLAIATAHSLIQALDLAGVLLWSNEDANESFELAANAGIDREGSNRVKILRLNRQPQFFAEYVVQTAKPLWVNRADRHPLTLEVEAHHCYIPAGAIACLPLRVGHQIVGVLELIAKESDHDFLASKDLHLTIAEHLGLALRSAILFEQVEQMATTDPLTGISNHRRLQEFVATQLEEAKHDSLPIGLIMIDVDHFRRFNEEEGHDSGDRVLQLVAQSLRENLRGKDLCARYGGEEFTVVLPGMDVKATASVAERIRSVIEKIEYTSKSGNKRQITASFGCSSSPESANDPDSLFKSADLALYQAKRSGRNQVAIARGDFDESQIAS